MKKSDCLAIAERKAREYVEAISLNKILGTFAEEESNGYYVTVTIDDGVRNGFYNRYIVAVNKYFKVTQCAKFEKVFEVFE